MEKILRFLNFDQELSKNSYISNKSIREVNFPLHRGGRRIGSSAFLSRRTFGYYLPIASYGTIFAAKWSSNGGLEAVVSNRLAQGQKGLTAHRYSFCFALLRQMRYFLSLTMPLS